MYPYKLIQNPYPSSSTPAVMDARILGGNRHKEGKSAVLSCIDELFSKIKGNATEKDFRLITVIQDVGSGKRTLPFTLKGCSNIWATSSFHTAILLRYRRDLYTIFMVPC